MQKFDTAKQFFDDLYSQFEIISSEKGIIVYDKVEFEKEKYMISEPNETKTFTERSFSISGHEINLHFVVCEFGNPDYLTVVNRENQVSTRYHFQNGNFRTNEVAEESKVFNLSDFI